MEVALTSRRRTCNPVHGNSPLTGQPFLNSSPAASTDFEDVTTFRQDYTALPLDSCRRIPVEPLPPASVIHKNSCYLKMHGSLTQSTYVPPTNLTSTCDKDVCSGGEGSEKSNKSNKMFATNFHLNADRRLDSHCTTNQEGFPPLALDPNSVNHRFTAHYKDVDAGPLGRRVFDPSAKSEYSSVFRGSQVKESGAETKLSLLKTVGARNTLTGTQRDCQHVIDCNELVTTHKDTFKGEVSSSDNTSSEMARRQRLRITCIPQGDRNKIAFVRSNHQTSYNLPQDQLAELGISGSTGSRPPPTRQINQSSIKLKDHTKPAQHYFTTTTTDTFLQPNKTERTTPLVRFSRNASFFPRGDLDPTRVKQRLNHATTKSAHPKPPPGSFPAHVNSCNFHTESSIHIGWSAEGNWLHPQGTMAGSYQPLAQVIHRAKAPSKDNLPLHYFSGHLTNSTTADSYRCLDLGHKLNKINPEALNDLKCSHWSLPNMGGSAYCTTHQECFTAPHRHAG